MTRLRYSGELLHSSRAIEMGGARWRGTGLGSIGVRKKKRQNPVASLRGWQQYSPPPHIPFRGHHHLWINHSFSPFSLLPPPPPHFYPALACTTAATSSLVQLGWLQLEPCWSGGIHTVQGEPEKAAPPTRSPPPPQARALWRRSPYCAPTSSLRQPGR